jgi:hypothetical protein
MSSRLRAAKRSRSQSLLAIASIARKLQNPFGWGLRVVGGCFARSLFAVSVVLGLGACAAGGPTGSAAEVTPSGNWRILRQVDPVSGKTASSALLETSQISNAAMPLAGGALLQLACFKGQPLVHLQFQFQVGSNQTSALGYRFDDKPGHDLKVHFLRGDKIFVIDEKSEVRRFVNELGTANVLVLRITSLTKGQTTAEFHVTGAAPAIDAAFAGCRPPAA